MLDADSVIGDPAPDGPARRLVDGPAGRALCRLVALVPGFGPVRTPLMLRVARPGPQPGPMELLDELEAVIATGNHERFLRSADEQTLVAQLAKVVVGGGLRRTVVDGVAIDEREKAVLAPVAAAIVAAPAAHWWPRPMAAHDQHLVLHHLGPGGERPAPPTLHNTVALRMAAEREAADRRISMSWSRPDGAWSTTRSLPGLPAVGLLCFPDPHAQLTARHWEVDVPPRTRVYEIGDVGAWRQLVARYPRDVTYSRRGAWQPLTGWEGPWLLPDWAAVALDFDGVHVSVTGYLEIVGLATPVDRGRTMLVGWGPDETYWLHDVIDLVGRPVEWVEEQEDYSALVIDEDGTY